MCSSHLAFPQCVLLAYIYIYITILILVLLTSLLVEEILLLRYVNLSTNFIDQPLRVEMAPSCLKHMYSVLFAFTWRPMPLAVCSRLCNRDLAWAGVLARSGISFTESVSEKVFGGYCQSR